MKKINVLLTLGILSLMGSAQNKKEQDRKSISSMAGCYEVTFNYSETFSPDKNYPFRNKEQSKGLEYIKVIEDDKNKISLQHLLIADAKDSTFIIKHWRQDWLYENTDLYSFNKNNWWAFTSLPKNKVKGQWTQKVYQVDDSPRYEGSSSWVHVDGKNYWENTADAPLPRREYTKRSDYNVLQRTNRQELTDYGWIHIQDNTKILRKDGNTDQVIAQERGENTYVKVNSERCLPAQQWWGKNSPKWDKVRESWNVVYNKNKTLQLKQQKSDIELFEILSDFNNSTPQKKIEKTIMSFVIE